MSCEQATADTHVCGSYCCHELIPISLSSGHTTWGSLTVLVSLSPLPPQRAGRLSSSGSQSLRRHSWRRKARHKELWEFPHPPSQIDEGADSSHRCVLFRSPIVFYCHQQQSRTVSLASQKDAALCKSRTHYEQSCNIIQPQEDKLTEV